MKDLIIFGLVTMLPIAPFQVYGYIAPDTYGMVPFVYLVGLIAMLFTALSYSQMSKAFPVAGSVYSYVQRGLNPHIGFVTGWLIIADYILVPALLYSFAGMWAGAIVPAVPTLVWVVLFILVNTYINARGITLAAKSNLLFLIMELLAVALFVTFMIKYVFIDGQGTGGLSMDPLYQAGKVDLSFIATAASIAVLGFLGFDVISTLSEEVKNPIKTVGRSTVLALLIIGGLFMLQAYLAGLAHPDFNFATTEEKDLALFNIAREVGGDFLYLFILVVGVIAVGVANALAVQSAISRILYSMSRDKLLPFSGFLGQIHPKYQTPFNATIFVAMISIVVAMTLSIETIIMFVNFGALTSFMMINLTVFIYYFIKRKERGLKALISYVLFPLIGFSVIAFVWSGFDKATYIAGFSWMAVGVIVGFIKSKGYKEVPPALKDL